MDQPSESPNYFTIHPVRVVTRGRRGSQEFTHSSELLHCLEDLARRQVKITKLYVSDRLVSAEDTAALNCFLRLHRGLRPAKKLTQMPSYWTKWHWLDLQDLVAMESTSRALPHAFS